MQPRPLAMLSIFVLGVALLLAPASNAAAPIGLGSAADFAVLAGAGITNTGETRIVGDVGSHPTDSITGFGTVDLTGTNHGADAVTALAKDDLVTAYDEADALPPDALVGQLGGLTLTPGVYADDNAPDSMSLVGTLTLDGMNATDPVFVFQSDSTLVLGSNANVLLTNGATSCNVFWQVGDSATLGPGAHLEGTVLAMNSITLGIGATVDGGVLARTASVTMINNTILRLPCEAAPTTSTSSTTPPPTTPPPTTPPPTTPPPTTPPPTTPPPTTPPPTTPPPTTPPPTTPPPTTPPPTTPPPTTPPPTTPPPTTPPPTSPPPTTPTPTTPPPTGPPPTSPPPTPPLTTPPAEIPMFPTPLAGVLAAVGALGASFVMLRRRR